MKRKPVSVPRLLAALGLCLVVGTGVHANDGKKNSAIDFVKNKGDGGPFVIMEESEFRDYCGHLYNLDEPLRLSDPNNAKLTEEELNVWREARDGTVEEFMKEYKPGMTVGDADHLGGTRPRSGYWKWWPKNLLIRRTYEERAITNATRFGDAQGAIFSFTRDFENVSDTWQARGAVMYPKKLHEDWSPGRGIASFYAMPSITFDVAANNTDETKEVDSLVARLGAELGVKNVGPPLQFFRADLAYASDSDLESGVLAVELDWEPVWPILGIGANQDVPLLPLEYRLRTVLHMEYGRVTATGNKESLEKDDNFFRYGPKLQVELFPTSPKLDRLSFIIKYEYLHGSSGEPGHSDLFEAAMSYQLDEEGYLGLDITYRNGDVPLTKEAVDSLTVGFSVKF